LANLLGIDKGKNQIIGRSMRICGNKTAENSVYSFNLNNRNEVSNIKSLDDLESHFVKSEIYRPSLNLNKLFLLSDNMSQSNFDVSGQKNLDYLKDYILHNQEIYAENEHFISICYKIIEYYDDYNDQVFSKINQMILSQNICKFLTFISENRSHF
jgi:hypothetical protein